VHTLSFNSRIVAIIASINRLSENYRTTYRNIACIRKNHVGPCIMGKRRQLLYILELARLQVFAEALSQRGTLASLLELHDDELMRLAQETGKSWAPNATIYWIKKTQKLRRQAQQFLDPF
jgi:hypothetical protein